MTPAELSKAAGINRTYAWQIVKGKRKPSLPVAITIYDTTGVQYGPLEGLTKREIEAARKLAA